MSNLLLLEDDISLIDGLNYSLKKNGFYVDIARTIEEAEKRLKEIERYPFLWKKENLLLLLVNPAPGKAPC